MQRSKSQMRQKSQDGLFTTHRHGRLLHSLHEQSTQSTCTSTEKSDTLVILRWLPCIPENKKRTERYEARNDLQGPATPKRGGTALEFFPGLQLTLPRG